MGESNLRLAPQRADVLATRLESLESEVGRLTDFLSSQVEARKKRRRRITIRLLLGAVALFAGLFAWYSAAFRASRQQAAAVDQLISEGVFVSYEPRDSLAVSLLPGAPESPPRTVATALGEDFFRAVTNVSTRAYTGIAANKKSVLPAVSSLTQLQRLRLVDLSLRTADLRPLAKLSHLKSLDLNRTGLDNGGLSWISSTQLQWFNASHTRMGDRVLRDLSQCADLQYLDMERTTVSDIGLRHLYGQKQLKHLNLKRCPISLAAVQKLSATIPNCAIQYEPLVFTPDGKVDARAARRGFIVLGKPAPPDPRVQNAVIPPSDSRNAQGFYPPATPPIFYPQQGIPIPTYPTPQRTLRWTPSR